MGNQSEVGTLASRLYAATEAVLAVARECTQEQWETTVPWRQPYEPVPEQNVASARLLVEWNLIYHRYDHLAQIKRVLGLD